MLPRPRPDDRPEPRSYGPWRRLCHLALALFVIAAAPAAGRERLILAFGDSLTAGYQLPPRAGFAPQLEAALRRDGHAVRVHNAGVSGDTSAAGRARLTWVLKSLPHKPDVAIVALGANDMLRGQPVETTRQNLDAILAELRRQQIPVVLAGMVAAPNLGAGYARDFNALFPELARRHGATLYPFFLQGVAANPRLQLADGMHPNAHGVGVMVAGIKPLVARQLAASSGG